MNNNPLPHRYTSALFTGIPNLIHGFSTKQSKDMREQKSREVFVKALSLDGSAIVWMDQIHGTKIHTIMASDIGTTVKGVDGLVYKYDQKLKKQPVLTVHVADCIPILAIDPKHNILGIAHGGWKGVVGHIGKNLVSVMKSLGSTPGDIIICLGPHIGPYCYEVNEERASQFERQFGKNTGVVIHRDHKWFVDIGEACSLDFEHSGVYKEQIDFDQTICTHCQTNELFSYRRTGITDTYGEIIGVIGYMK